MIAKSKPSENHLMRTTIVVLFLLASQLVNAAGKTWSGNTSTDWGTASNWSGNSVPSNGDDVTIPTTPAGGRMPTISADCTVKSITIQSGATLTHTGGVLSVISSDLSVTGTYTISGGTFYSNKDVTVNSGGLISQSGGTIHLSSNSSSDPNNHLVISAGGEFELSAGTVESKDLTTTSGSPDGTFTQTGGTFRIFHDFKNKGIYNATAGTIEFASDGGGASFPVEVTSGNTQFYNVVINSGVDPKFTNQVISFNVSGNWTNNSSGLDLSAKATTVTLNGTGSQTIGGSQSTIFRNLTIAKSAGTVTLSVNQSVDAGNLSITGGTVDLGTYTLNRATSGGTLTLSNGCGLKMASNTGGQTGSNFPSNFSTVTLGSTSTIEYSGSNAITQTIYGGMTYGNLSLTNGTGSGSATKTTTANLTVNGNLTINSNTVLNPGAAYTVGGSGTLTGSGTAQVTRTSATADFNTQYTITTKTLTNLTVDYYAASAQTVNALNYNNLTISGTRTTNSVTLANSGTIGISGTFTPSASFTSGNYISTSSTVNFNGSSPQNIPAFSFNNLTISTSAKTATGVINVNGAFTLSSCILTTTATNLLAINDNATVAGASYTSYVNGPVKKTGNDAFTFPVGKSGTGYMLIGISAPGVITDAFTAEYMRSSATGLGSITASGLIRVSNCDYWNLSRTTGSSAVDVTISWNGYSNCNTAAYVNDLSSLTVAHFNGTSWDSHGKNSSTGNVSSGSITRNSVSSFSPFAVGSTSDYNNPLEVKFTSIRASRQAGGIKIDWTNLAETTMDHYEVERSFNTGPFTKAAQITASINGGNKANYDWLDASPISSPVLYRIKAVGVDGKFAYSTTVKIDPEQQSELIIYPNPVEGYKLNLQTGNTGAGKYQADVFDMNGRKLQSQSFVNSGGSFSQSIDLPANMKPGVYSLRVTGNNLNQVKTFLVK